MKKQSKQSKVSRLLYVSILIIGISMFSSMRVNATSVSYDQPSYSSLTPHDPISITSDSGLAIFPGSGTEEDPYIIEGYNITTTEYTGISLSGTTKHFVISNCYVDADLYGIIFTYVADGTATVINNTCSNNNNYGSGIVLRYSGGSTITNNTCNNNYEGIKLVCSGSSTVTNNTCSNNGDGIYLYDSDSSTVANNIFTNCGLRIIEHSIDAYLLYTVENNWVNEKILGFYANLESTTIAEPVYGQLILVNCNSVTVRDQVLNNATIGLSLYYCTDSTINNNICNNNNYGIYLVDSGSSNVAKSTCNNNRIGIYLLGSGSSDVINNTCSNNNYGILLSSSNSSTVINNTCSNNDFYGIELDYSDFCVIAYNTLQENGGYGVYLRSLSDNNLFHHNTFVDNNLGGTSQAYDDETNNCWYDSETQEGNYWSDWSGIGAYYIDGPASSEDLYPLDEPAEYSTAVSTTDETQIYFTFALLMVVVPLLLTKLFSRKKRKID